MYEAVGHAKAYDFLYEISHSTPLTEEVVCAIHRLFYQQIDPDRAGVYRKVPVFISGSQYAVSPVAEISKRMKQLVDWYNNHEDKIHPVKLAAELHRRFVYIHPFIDGNGRVSRLLMNLALMRNDYNIAIISAVCRAEYIAALEQGHKDADIFTAFVADRVCMTQLDILRLFRETEPDKKPTDLKEQLLKTIVSQPGLNAPTLSKRTGRSLRTIQRYLGILKSEGKIHFQGVAKKGGYYAT